MSPVVESAAQGLPIVGIAVPFRSAESVRVFSSGLDVQASTLGEYLRTAVPLPSAEPFLVDGIGLVLASGTAPETMGARFVDVRPSLARALDLGERSADVEGRPHTVTAFSVRGTTWTVLVATPPESGPSPPLRHALMVVVWLLLALVGAASVATATASRAQRLTANARFRSTFDNPSVRTESLSMPRSPPTWCGTRPAGRTTSPPRWST